jgi:hypothetical protein
MATINDRPTRDFFASLPATVDLTTAYALRDMIREGLMIGDVDAPRIVVESIVFDVLTNFEVRLKDIEEPTEPGGPS